MSARFIIGDTRAVVASLPDASIDLVLTSPPFLALRSYLPADHPDKYAEIGSERCPADWLDTMLDLTEDWARVLTPHGSIAVEIGDIYAGSGGSGGDYDPGGLRAGQQRFNGSARSSQGTRTLAESRLGVDARNRGNTLRGTGAGGGWPLPKSLCMVPALYSASLAYGWNMLYPERTTPRWRVRNVIRWVRPNPSPGALSDRVRSATTEITTACKASTRWFDLDAVRTRAIDQRHADTAEVMTANYVARVPSNPAGAPPLDWWSIPPGGFSGAHFAVWPPVLVERLVQLMCPRRVCRTCGHPSRRLITGGRIGEADDTTRHKSHAVANSRSGVSADVPEIGWEYDHTTTGWSTCGCPGTDGIRLDGYHSGTGWRPGMVLDPFGGSGTTAVVCTGHGRDSILVDLDERNAALARERVGMWLEVEDHRPTEVIA